MQNISLNRYFNLDKKISSRGGRKNLRGKIRIALLGSFTLNGFKEALNVKCYNAGIDASFYTGGYNQYAGELIDEHSKFYKFKPDITFLLVDVRSLLGDLYADPYSLPEKKRKETVSYNSKKLDTLVRNFTKRGSGILVINNFQAPVYSPMGILEPKQGFGLFDMVRVLNLSLSKFNKQRNVFVFDYDCFASRIGKNNITSDKLLYLADMRILPDIIPLLCEEYMRYIRALKGLSRKCIVLDLDNTLWGGIVGEDGVEGIKLGPQPPGNAYMEFQRYLLALFHRGIILAVNSNNNRSDVMKVLKGHPQMLLRERHFASIKVNWENKVRNLIEIAKDINIGLNSIIYLDDDKRNRQIVKEALPEVLCPELGEDASGYLGCLTEIKELDALQITHEDSKRGRLYAAERKRRESIGAFRDLSGYLKHLNIVAEVRPADKFSIPRLSQLTLRTNQFNFSAKRYSQKEIEGMARDGKYGIYYVRVRDKYGDYGITSALIIRKDKRGWFIDTFVMSCRILGRNIEEAVLSDIIKRAVREEADRVDIDYRRTASNQPAFNFLEQYGVFKGRPKLKNAAVTLYEKGKKSGFGRCIKHVKLISG